jgi:hypothetical protein
MTRTIGAAADQEQARDELGTPIVRAERSAKLA